jgi:HD-GYP domain-containing protein (c-di-GMP phosphodiesterase class II)
MTGHFIAGESSLPRRPPAIPVCLLRGLAPVFAGPAERLGLELRTVAPAAWRRLAAAAADGADGAPQQILIGPADDVKAGLKGAPACPATVFIAIHAHGGTQAWMTADSVADVVEAEAGKARLELALRRAQAVAQRITTTRRLAREATLSARLLRELNSIGVALSTEHDLDRLLSLIVSKSRELTQADAGSLYLVDRDEDGEPKGTLHFRVAQNDTLNSDFSAFRMPINRNSIAGYVALEGEILHLDDVYELPADSEYSFNRSFDDSTGYRSKSMLVVPMRNHHGRVTGVLQLINRKKDFDVALKSAKIVERQVEPFTAADRELVASIASQAAVAIENAQLYEDIQRQFESFIHASVSAIEARDPTTSGHSERVAVLTTGLAEVVDQLASGPFRRVTFSRAQMQEILFASLLHDFGKIGVREHVLIKAKKLFPFELEAIELRYRLIRKTLQLRVSEQALAAWRAGRKDAAAEEATLRNALASELQRLAQYLDVIRTANEPAILAADAAGGLKDMLNVAVDDPDGDMLRLLLPDEFMNLSIPRGSLNDGERKEIESHVSHTYRFLQLIPWTRDFRHVAEIAWGHHEKLDGSGYPRGVKAAEIPLQTRMMTISDIFDALTATDRPYKRAVPVERALDILGMEVREGKLDKALYEVFVESRVYERVPAGQAPTP